MLRRAAEALEAEIAKLAQSDRPPERRDRIIAKRTRQREDAIHEGQTSCYNAAIGYVNAGNKSLAKRYADQAAQVERFKDKAVELLARIDRMK